MTERRTRWAWGGAAGALWAATVCAAVSDLHLKAYLTLWLATLIVSLGAVAVWVTRSDHEALGRARAKIELARLQGALLEESEGEARKRQAGKRIDHFAGKWS